MSYIQARLQSCSVVLQVALALRICSKDYGEGNLGMLLLYNRRRRRKFLPAVLSVWFLNEISELLREMEGAIWTIVREGYRDFLNERQGLTGTGLRFGYHNYTRVPNTVPPPPSTTHQRQRFTERYSLTRRAADRHAPPALCYSVC